jgi:5-methylcytosine-specific restriction protein A
LPERSKKMCAIPGCPNMTTSRWCDEHKKTPAIARPYDARRGSASSRGYDAAWKKLRLVALRRDLYLCQDCLKTGRPTQAEEVHHIISIAEDADKRLDLDNLLSLCGPCHLVHTQEEQGIWGRTPTKKA